MSLAPMAAALGEVLDRKVRFVEDCTGPAAEQAVELAVPWRRPGAGKHPLPRRRGKERPRFRCRSGQTGRHLRQRCILRRSPRPCQHRGCGAPAASLCRPSHAGRARGTRCGVGQPGAPGRGDRRRRQGVHQAGTCWAIWSSKVNVLIIGGAMANTFLAAQGKGVGKSLQEAEMHGTALEILAKARQAGCRIVLPTDAVVARELKPNTPTETVSVDAVPADMMILDVGPASVASLIQLSASAEDPCLERSARRLRNPAVRCRHHGAGACRGRGYAEVRAAQRCRRRRHGVGAPPRRRDREIELRVLRRRRLPGMDGRQDAAWRRRSRKLSARGSGEPH